jgi:hypothetical protein
MGATGKPSAKKRVGALGDATAAWLAIAHIDAEGRKAAPGTARTLALVTVCVHSGYPKAVSDRLNLLKAVMAKASAIVKRAPCLIVLPGGFFGFLGEAPVSSRGAARIDSAVRSFQAARRPAETIIAVGLDRGKSHPDQSVWVWPSGASAIVKITRGATSPEERTVRILGGALSAAFFVCGEFTGSRTGNNLPYFEQRFLLDAAREFPGHRLLVDLAHRMVPRTVNRVSTPRRYVHQRQMELQTPAATSILTHHHPGAKRSRFPGAAQSRSRSDWILFKGGQWFAGLPCEVGLAEIGPHPID